MLPGHLLRVFKFMFDSPGHVGVQAAMLLSFRAVLWKSHVSVSECTLQRRDFAFHRWGMMVTVRRSKTIQFKERTHLIPVSYVLERRLCAVYWVKKHFDQLPALGRQEAFRLPRGAGSTALTYHYYLSLIKLLCTWAGLELLRFTTHSLRRGATFLRLCGASISEIKERGDWRSDAVYEYLKASLMERLSLDMRVAALLGAL